MTLEAFYASVYALGGLAEVTLLVVLLVRRQYRQFPIFTCYIAFNVCSDLAVALLSLQSGGNQASWVALFLLPPQYLLEIGVLVEIGWRLLKPINDSLPRQAFKVFLTVSVIAVLAGVALALHVDPHSTGIYEKLKFPLDITVGLLRMILFLAMLAFAELLGIGWKDKVLQLAMGLSFYSSLDLAGSLIQGHFGVSQIANHLKGGAYLVELGFFIWVFTTKEAERRDFSPQMQQFLVTLSTRVRSTRSAIERSEVK